MGSKSAKLETDFAYSIYAIKNKHRVSSRMITIPPPPMMMVVVMTKKIHGDFVYQRIKMERFGLMEKNQKRNVETAKSSFSRRKNGDNNNNNDDNNSDKILALNNDSSSKNIS